MNLSDLNELDFNNIAAWPLPVKILAILLITSAVLFAGYWFDIKDQLDNLEAAQKKEIELRSQFESKQAIAASLDAYRQQMQEMEKTFGALLQKLPGKTEIAELLVDVTRVGVNSGLEFELFKPGAEVPKEFYAEFPINLRVTGTYHDFGNFASGIAALPRIVTLHDLTILPSAKKNGKKGDLLVMQATANTYRYLEKGEMKKIKKKAGKKKRN